MVFYHKQSNCVNYAIMKKLRNVDYLKQLKVFRGLKKNIVGLSKLWKIKSSASIDL